MFALALKLISMAFLGQIGFSSAFMLAWGVAALIPIAIHLLYRKRRVIVSWAAMQLLQKVIEQQSRRIHFMQVLLLLTRIAVLCVLALSLARPFWLPPESQRSTVQQPKRLWILMIDLTYSMGYHSDGISLLDLAKKQVGQLVSTSQKGDAFAVIAMAQPSQAIIGSPTYDTVSVLNEIQQLAVTSCGSDLVTALAMASDIANDSRQNASLPRETTIVIYSDLGVDTWQSAIHGEAAAALTQLSGQVGLRIEPLLDGVPSNVAIEEMTISTDRPVVGGLLEIDVTVASYGHATSELPVELQLNENIVSTQVVSISADQKAVLRWQVAIKDVGWNRLSAKIPGDNLPGDDRFDRVALARFGNRILIVQPDASTWNAWKLALQPPSIGNQPTSDLDHIRLVSSLNWPTISLDSWDLVILDDTSLRDPIQLARLTDYVREGGSALLSLGRRQKVDQQDLAHQPWHQLVGYQLTTPSHESLWSIDPGEYRSPLLKPFEGFPNAGLLSTPIFRYWQIDSREADLLIDAALSNGDPLIVRRALGHGWVASILSAPADGREEGSTSAWNAMTTWPSFLPLAQRLSELLMVSQTIDNNRLAGQPISARFSSLSPVSSIRMRRPDQTEINVTCNPINSSSRISWEYADTAQRGIYQVMEPAAVGMPFAVNIDPIQSSMQKIDHQGIAQYLIPPTGPEQKPETASSSSQGTDRIARAMLMILMALLVVESGLAWWIGKRIE